MVIPKDPVKANQKGALFGYFYQHENERVYATPLPDFLGLERTIVPCYECKKAIEKKF